MATWYPTRYLNEIMDDEVEELLTSTNAKIRTELAYSSKRMTVGASVQKQELLNARNTDWKRCESKTNDTQLQAISPGTLAHFLRTKQLRAQHRF
jgi:hypothetical protein